MNDVLEKQAALTTPIRKVLAKTLHTRYQYTLPKSVDGIFSIYCLRFEQRGGYIDFSKPIQGALVYLLERKSDLKNIEQRLIERSMETQNGTFPSEWFECALYIIGNDNTIRLAARYDNGKKKRFWPPSNNKARHIP